MINRQKLSAALEEYKKDFDSEWQDEKYKWQAVKCFQDNWDIKAPVFGEMFDRATAQDKTQNLLTSKMVYPRRMILEFAKADDNATREMFQMLFDESRDLSELVSTFKKQADTFVDKYGKGKWKSHYQNTNYISTYLWLKYSNCKNQRAEQCHSQGQHARQGI